MVFLDFSPQGFVTLQRIFSGLLHSQITPLGNQLLSQIQSNPQMYLHQTMFRRPMPVCFKVYHLRYSCTCNMHASHFSNDMAVSFGNQQPNQSVAASFPANMANFSNSSAINPAINQFSATAVSTQNVSSSSIQSPAFFNASLSNSEVVGQKATDVQLGYVNGEILSIGKQIVSFPKNCLVASFFVFVLHEWVYWYDGMSVGNMLILSECDRNNLPTTVASGDSNIWLKEKWTPGEVKDSDYMLIHLYIF